MQKANDMGPEESPSSPESTLTDVDDHRLESIRSILLAGDREQINALAAETAALEKKSQEEKEALMERIQTLQQELDRLRDFNRQGLARADQLQEELDLLRLNVADDQENRIPFLVDRISEVISKAAKESRVSLAHALSPVMGPAISNQIRNSQDEMVDALQPIILRTVQKAIAEFARDLQRNIDARLKATLGPGGLVRSLTSRVRGVDDADLLLRDSLPFSIDELFLIQRDSGLLVDYSGVPLEEGREKELIGGMLTAIRDFTHDSFGDSTTEEELDEIHYGDQRIIIEGGTAAYVAAAVSGVDPPGFRVALRDFVSEEHLYYGDDLRRYDGDLAGMPDFNAELNEFRGQYAAVEAPPPKPMSTGERWMLIGGGMGALLLLALSCFYLQFTIALLPVAFGETATPTSTMRPSATVTKTAVPTITPAASSTETPTSSPSATPSQSVVPSATPTMMMTVTPSPSAVPSTTPTLTTTALPSNLPVSTRLTIAPPYETGVLARAIAPVWTQREPERDSQTLFIIPANGEITILSRSDDWLEIEFITADGPQQGWVPQRWVEIP